MSKWRYFDYLCEECNTVSESMEDRYSPPDTMECAICGEKAERTVSSANVGTVWASAVTTAKSEPTPPHVMETQPMGDGQSRKDFKKNRRKLRQDRMHNMIRRELG